MGRTCGRQVGPIGRIPWHSFQCRCHSVITCHSFCNDPPLEACASRAPSGNHAPLWFPFAGSAKGRRTRGRGDGRTNCLTQRDAGAIHGPPGPRPWPRALLSPAGTAAAGSRYPMTIMWSVDTIDWRPLADGGPTAYLIASKIRAAAPGSKRPAAPRRIRDALPWRSPGSGIEGSCPRRSRACWTEAGGARCVKGHMVPPLGAASTLAMCVRRVRNGCRSAEPDAGCAPFEPHAPARGRPAA
jgi:hypothetical protein